MKEFPQDLRGAALDWAVGVVHEDGGLLPVAYSTDWQFGGPIIEREKITLNTTHFPNTSNVTWVARHPNHLFSYFGETALIAAMKSYVASKFGEGIEVPDLLMGE